MIGITRDPKLDAVFREALKPKPSGNSAKTKEG